MHERACKKSRSYTDFPSTLANLRHSIRYDLLAKDGGLPVHVHHPKLSRTDSVHGHKQTVRFEFNSLERTSKRIRESRPNLLFDLLDRFGHQFGGQVHHRVGLHLCAQSNNCFQLRPDYVQGHCVVHQVPESSVQEALLQ